jgi:hypothetical protein
MSNELGRFLFVGIELKKFIMKIILIISALFVGVLDGFSQEVLHVQNGSSVSVQNGVELTLKGGVTLDNGSILLNNGFIRLANNSISNISNWLDNSVAGALSGIGTVIFNSTQLQNFSGKTTFYVVEINTAGLNLSSNFTTSHLLHLIKGKINTNAFYVFLNDNSSSSLLNDVSNAAYVNSWINGNFRRLITSNSSTYDFPVGNAAKCNLLQFLNSNITGSNYLTASFGVKPGTDAGLSVSENGSAYTAINNGGVWYLTPDVQPSSGSYALQLYFNGFTGLADNQFGMLRRPDASTNAADWKVPSGSSLEAFNGVGRKVSDGFARRFNISNFSQWGIGTLSTIPCDNCAVVCTYTQGFYANQNGKACNGTNSSVSSSQLMLNAFGATTSQVFGNIANRQFFTLYKTDISNGNIFKMLPGSGNSQPIAVDNILPYDGAYYSNQSTWYLVPIATSGSSKGKINNQLLSQTMSLWFNLHNSAALATVNLANDTLLTTAQTKCGSGIPTGLPSKFGLPHDVIVYLNGANGYANNVSGLFQLANDVLGGVNVSVNPLSLQYAVAAINNAFDGCRILTATIPYRGTNVLTNAAPKLINEKNDTPRTLQVTAFPNPYSDQFSLKIVSPVSGMAIIEFFAANGTKIFGDRKFLSDRVINVVPYNGPRHSGALVYKISVGDYHASGFVIGIN